jgi:multidrug efflux system membrane fusion protein
VKRACLALSFLVACGSPAGEGPGGKGGPGGPPGPGGKGPGRAVQFPVEVVTVKATPVEYRVTAVGSLDAFEVVEVTARVPGVVERVAFTEGDAVKAGALLVEIEPARYRLAADAARARLAQAEAQQAEARGALARRAAVEAERPGLLPAEELAAAEARLRVAEAAAAEARARADLAALDLRDALVRAPLAGTLEARLVRTGQYVQPGARLATLVRRDPLLLRFQVPEREAAALAPGAAARFTAGDDAAVREASIIHVAGAADPSTRMVAVTARVAGAAGAGLRPGAFAEVTVPVPGPAEAPVIPETAIRPSDRGFLAFVIEGGEVARERVLRLGLRTASGEVEVREGLAAGEVLVVRGADALRDGAKVTVKGPGGPAGERAPPAAAEGSARPARGGAPR